MNTRTIVTTVNPMRLVRRLAIPLLMVETLGLIGLVTSWYIAGAAAIVLTIAVTVKRALRRASQQIDTILREELTTLTDDAECDTKTAT